MLDGGAAHAFGDHLHRLNHKRRIPAVPAELHNTGPLLAPVVPRYPSNCEGRYPKRTLNQSRSLFSSVPVFLLGEFCEQLNYYEDNRRNQS